MRELKFRAWYDNGETKEMMFAGDSYGTKHPLDCCKYLMEGQPVVLMQYTGLKDFFNNEIYEGDIVFLDSHMRNYEIFMDCGAWKLKYIDQFKKECFEWLCDYYEDLHVIGNIHQNPELLVK